MGFSMDNTDNDDILSLYTSIDLDYPVRLFKFKPFFVSDRHLDKLYLHINGYHSTDDTVIEDAEELIKLVENDVVLITAYSEDTCLVLDGRFKE